jgi:hypothetical protein
VSAPSTLTAAALAHGLAAAAVISSPSTLAAPAVVTGAAVALLLSTPSELALETSSRVPTCPAVVSAASVLTPAPDTTPATLATDPSAPSALLPRAGITTPATPTAASELSVLALLDATALEASDTAAAVTSAPSRLELALPTNGLTLAAALQVLVALIATASATTALEISEPLLLTDNTATPGGTALDQGISPAVVQAAMDKAEARGTIKGQTLSAAEKKAMMKEFVVAPKQSTQMVWEVAPDPGNAALTAQWNTLPLQDRSRITKQVKDSVLGDLLTLVGIQPGKSAPAMGGFDNFTNPNFITEYNPKQVSVEQARALASAIGLTLDQASVALVDGRIQDTAGLVRVTLDTKTAPHAQDMLAAIQQRVPGLHGFTARGNNFDVLNFDTGLTIEQLHSQITEAMDGLDLDAEYKASYGETHSELVEKDAYEGHITGLRPDAEREVLEGLRGLRDRARGLVTAEIGKASGEGLRGGPRTRTERAGAARRDAAEGAKLSPPRRVDAVHEFRRLAGAYRGRSGDGESLWLQVNGSRLPAT